MSPRQHEEFFVTFGCVGLSAIALMIGVWIAAAPSQAQVAREQWTLAQAAWCDTARCAAIVPARWEP